MNPDDLRDMLRVELKKFRKQGSKDDWFPEGYVPLDQTEKPETPLFSLRIDGKSLVVRAYPEGVAPYQSYLPGSSQDVV